MWNLANRNIGPRLLVALFENLPANAEGEPLEINVAPNRLQDMTTEQFETVLSTLEKMRNLRVRFGYDVFMPNIEKAMATMDKEARQRVHIDFPFEALRRAVETLEQFESGVNQFTNKMDAWLDTHKGWQKNVNKSIEHEMTRALVSRLQDGFDYTPRLEYLRSGRAKDAILMQLDGVVLAMSKEGRLQLILLEVKNSLRMCHLDEESAEAKVRYRFPEDDAKKLKKKIAQARRDTISRRRERFLAVYRDTDAWLANAQSHKESELVRGQKLLLDDFKGRGVTENDVVCAVGAILINEPEAADFVLQQGWYLVQRDGGGCSVERQSPTGTRETLTVNNTNAVLDEADDDDGDGEEFNESDIDDGDDDDVL